MKIVIAPNMSLLAKAKIGSSEFDFLSLEDLPSYASILIPGNWYDFLLESHIADSYEMFSILLRITVDEFIPSKKSDYIKLLPDILDKCSESEKRVAKQQIYEMSFNRQGFKIYSYTDNVADTTDVYSDKHHAIIHHVRPDRSTTIAGFIRSLEPHLRQLKHDDTKYDVAGETVSPFSAYNRNDESYARRLLRQAYEDHNGEVDDRTYLYTYDSKNRTFVEFRPSRNNEYHGMDISLDSAKRKAPDIVRLYHK